jgi:8-amino-7-oxononanoate synthase
LSSSLQKRQELNALRSLVVNDDLIDFCSNDYLGFARSEILKNNILKEYADTPGLLNGSGGSRLLAGNSAYAEKLEQEIAGFHDAEAGLIFNSGYDANVGLFSSLGQKEATIIYDELIHASVHDGIRMSNATSYMFRHNDLFHLEERLKAAEGTVYIAVESIYSMDGDQSALLEISALCKKYDANLIVDEAHATGITSNGGKGLVQLFNLQNDVFARVHTFGKALGCHGAIVIGSTLLRNYLINFSRAFIYTTSLPVKSLIAIHQSYELLKKSNDSIERLQKLILFFKEEAAKHSGIHLALSNSPIQCIIYPGNTEVKGLAAAIRGNGFDVRPILSPTVQKGRERLRVCVHAFNTQEQISLLMNLINSNLQTTNS